MTLRQPDRGEPLPDDACLADYGVGAADEVELELIVAYRTEREMRAEAEENARREAEDFACRGGSGGGGGGRHSWRRARLADTDRPSLPETLRVTVRGARRGEPSRVVTVRIGGAVRQAPALGAGSKDAGTVYHHASNQTIPTTPRVEDQVHHRDADDAGQVQAGADQSRGVHADGVKGSRHGESRTPKLGREVHDPRGGDDHQEGHTPTLRSTSGVCGRGGWRTSSGSATTPFAGRRRRKRRGRRRRSEGGGRDGAPDPAQNLGRFRFLYGELEQWRVRETAKVEAEFPETDARRLAMSRLLTKETELIRTIGRLRIAANNANRERRVERARGHVADEAVERKDGSLVEVDTPFTVRQELARLYARCGWRRAGRSTDERLDVLVHVK